MYYSAEYRKRGKTPFFKEKSVIVFEPHYLPVMCLGMNNINYLFVQDIPKVNEPCIRLFGYSGIKITDIL